MDTGRSDEDRRDQGPLWWVWWLGPRKETLDRTGREGIDQGNACKGGPMGREEGKKEGRKASRKERRKEGRKFLVISCGSPQKANLPGKSVTTYTDRVQEPKDTPENTDREKTETTHTEKSMSVQG